jgi:hypothetical protein
LNGNWNTTPLGGTPRITGIRLHRSWTRKKAKNFK